MPVETQSGPRRRAVPSRRRLILGVVVGAVLGVLAGLGLAAKTSAQQSTALLDLSSALTQDGTGTPSPDQADRFVQSELLYLNSTGFQRAVVSAAGDPPGVTLAAAQVGTTDVVQITAAAPVDADAVKAADQAIGAYAQHRKDVLNEEVAGLQTQLTAAQHNLTTATDAAAAATASTLDLTPLRDRVNTLQAALDNTQATANSAGVGGTVIETAKDAGASPTVSRSVAGGTGLAVGILLGLLVVGLPQLVSRRRSATDGLPDLGISLATPALPAAAADWVDHLGDRRSDERLESASRLLAARLADPLSARRPLVVVGAAPGVGASFTAVNLATALARRRRTVLIPAGDITEGTVAGWLGVSTERQDLVQLTRPGTVSRIESALCKTPVSNLCLLPVAPSERWEQMEEALAAPTIRLLLEAGWTVVVDCPPATASTAVFELARLDPVIGVVVGGRTTADELAAAVDRLPGDRSQMTVLVDEGRHEHRHGPRQHRPAVPTNTVPTKTVPTKPVPTKTVPKARS